MKVLQRGLHPPVPALAVQVQVLSPVVPVVQVVHHYPPVPPVPVAHPVHSVLLAHLQVHSAAAQVPVLQVHLVLAVQAVVPAVHLAVPPQVAAVHLPAVHLAVPPVLLAVLRLVAVVPHSALQVLPVLL